MRRSTRRRFDAKPEKKLGWVGWLAAALFLLITAGFLYLDYQRSEVVGSPYRYNMAVASQEGDVAFVSYDPEEKQIFVLPYPRNLEIKSRSVGTYRVENLYKLGSYEGEPGTFVRRKMQGFMRVPVAGYVTTTSLNGSVRRSLTQRLRRALWNPTGTSLSRMDAVVLLIRLSTYEWREGSQEELVRGGVLTRVGDVWRYSHERLKSYLGARVFDWTVGDDNITVAIINNSGIDGLGSDLSEFFSNLGFDVVMVKNGTTSASESTAVVFSQDDKEKYPQISSLLTQLFGWKTFELGVTSDYRAKMVVTVGKDAVELF